MKATNGKSPRGGRTSPTLSPRSAMSPPAPTIGKKRAAAATALAPIKSVPLRAPSKDESGAANVVMSSTRPMLLHSFCLTITELGYRRRAVIRAELSLLHQARALARRRVGFHTGLPLAERARLAKEANAIVKRIEAGELADAYGHGAAIGQEVVLCAAARRIFEDRRCELENEMTARARQLPVYPWIETVRGVGALGLAVIIAESGDLDGYANPGKLWKRLGHAVIRGRCQRKCVEKTEADEQGYNPKRKSVVWAIGDCLIKGAGSYYEVYTARKAYELERATQQGGTVDTPSGAHKMMQGWAHRRAAQYMRKRFLRDLWRNWRAASGYAAVDTQDSSAAAACLAGDQGANDTQKCFVASPNQNGGHVKGDTQEAHAAVHRCGDQVGADTQICFVSAPPNRARGDHRCGDTHAPRVSPPRRS